MAFSGSPSSYLALLRKGWMTCTGLNRGVALLVRSLCSSQKPPSPHHQLLTSDKKTIVCLHPTKTTPYEESQFLRSPKPHLDNRSESLTEDQVALIRKLRSEDGSLWSINTLAKLFNVKRVLISKVAPANTERQQELIEEEETVAAMKTYKRKIYITQKRMLKEKRLSEVLAQKLYPFPGLEKKGVQKKNKKEKTLENVATAVPANN